MKQFFMANWGHALTGLASVLLTLTKLSQGKKLLALAWAFLALTRFVTLHQRYQIYKTI